MRAGAAGNTAAVKSLLHAGAEPRRADAQGWTSLLLAARQGHEDVVRALLEHHSNNGDGSTDGAWADASAEDDAIMSIMLAVGADTGASGVEVAGVRLQRVVDGIVQRGQHAAAAKAAGREPLSS